MAYIDKDGDYILETRDELWEFTQMTICEHCDREAMELWNHLRGKDVVKIVFSTTCEHGGN